MYIFIYTHTDTATDTQRQTQPDRQTDRQKHTHTHGILLPIYMYRSPQMHVFSSSYACILLLMCMYKNESDQPNAKSKLSKKQIQKKEKAGLPARTTMRGVFSSSSACILLLICMYKNESDDLHAKTKMFTLKKKNQ